MKQSETLRTHTLPKFNCSNCEHFVYENKEVLWFKKSGWYAMECKNLTHPLIDCVLKGFEAHSAQPGFSQTLNK